MKTCVFKLGNQTYLFKFYAGMFSLAVSFIILFCILGAWQIKRYEFKQNLIQSYDRGLIQPAKEFVTVMQDTQDADLRRVITQGHYQAALTFLLPNKMYHSQLGYEVFTPLQIAHEKKLLIVDRGWIPAAMATSFAKPEVGIQAVPGYLKTIDKHVFILGENILPANSVANYQLQKIDLNDLQKLTSQTYFPIILRLDPKAPNGFTRDWIIVNMLPARHLGYAVQWFVMAMVLAIALICFCCERINEKTA
jgi:surfeit locus 1 family protein